jgi:hypothetical protein
MIPDGARVEYTGKGMMLSPYRLGQFGTVISSLFLAHLYTQDSMYDRWSRTFDENTQVLNVQWDGVFIPQTVFAPNVKVISSKPQWEV